MWRTLARGLQILLIGLLVLYLGDWAVLHLRGGGSASVPVEQFLRTPLKGQKEEFDFLGTVAMPCSRSLFPQSGLDPCWYMRRNPNQWQNL